MMNTIRIIVLLALFSVKAVTKSCAQEKKDVYANNRHILVARNEDGVFAKPYIFSKDQLHNKEQWIGKWIWLNQQLFPDKQRTQSEWIKPANASNNIYSALFRKTFNLEAIPGDGVLFITGDVRFQVYVNDSLAGEGPVNIGSDYGDQTAPAYWYYSSFDVRKWLKRGKNSIAIAVFSWGLEMSETTSSYGRLLCELTNRNKVIVASDESWKSIADTAYRYVPGFLQLDALKEPAGWKANAFNDKTWPAASIQSEPDPSKLFRDNIPSLMNYPVQPVLVTRTGSADKLKTSVFNRKQKTGIYLLDFGKNIPAHISFSVTAAAGDTIEVTPCEKLEQSTNRSIRYICRQGINNYRTPNISPFRYLKLKIHSPAGMTVQQFTALFSSYPVQHLGAFSCSDDFYTRLWSIIRYSTQMCMSNLFFDSPQHQEPIGCTGDYFIESMNNYYAFGDQWLTRQNLVQTAQMMEKNNYKMFHTSYSLLWVQMLRQYVRYTGDTALCRQLLPHADKLMARFITYLDADNLVSNAPNYMFMDWITIKGFNAHHPPAMIGMGYLSILLYKAMSDIDAMRAMITSKETMPVYEVTAEKIKKAINQLLWDSSRQLYKDGIAFRTKIPASEWLPADSALTTYSAHINTLAVLYDIAPANVQQRLTDYVITQQEYELQPYFMSFVLGAMKKLELTDKGLELVNRWQNGIDTTTMTLKENWREKTDFGYGGDYSHAWGGAPLLYLSEQILGITPGSPGYDTINIHPYTGDKITWAQGKVPVGDNAFTEVSWKKDARGYLFIYTVPQGKHAVFYLPPILQDYKTMFDNKVWQHKSGSLLLKPGKHRLLFVKNDY